VEKPRGASNLTNDFQDNLRQYLEDRLPSYMMPAYYLALGKIPMTPNGKVDKNALPLPGQGLGLVGEYAPPRNDLEKKLVDIWSEVLKRSPETISININFFKIGGHSLKATILASRIYKEFNVKISLVEIFKNPTIKGLFTYINQAAGEMYFGIEAVEEREYYVLSSAQKRLYFLQQMDNSGTTYNIPSAWIIEGGIDKTNLELSMMKIIQRHESLRTSFELIEEEPVQRIHKSVEFEIEYDELAANNAKTHEEKIDAFIKHFTRPFDLSRSPLLRVGLAPLKEKSHLLMIDMHHIISDGVSTDILVREFTSLYLGGELPGINLQYKDYAEWQNREKMSEDHLKQCMYWKKEFTGEIPILDLPTDYERSAAQGYVGSRINFEICSDVAEALKSLSLETGTTLYMVLTAFYCIFLAKISGRDDIIIGSPVVGRRHADLEKIIGMFVNTLALRNYPSGEKKFCDFLAEVKEKVLLAFENQEYQYEDLVDELNIRRDAGRNPLFDTMFELQNIGRQIIDIPGLTFKPFTYENETAKFDLTLVACENNGAIDFSLEYCTKLFKKETIERFIGYFTQIIISVIKKPDARIYDIEMVGEEEHKQLLTAIRNEENKILAGDMKAIQQIPAIVEGDFDF
jgi:acyl carrier protein